MASVDEKVKQIVVEQLGVDEAEVTPSASFVDDLGGDLARVLGGVEVSDAIDAALARQEVLPRFCGGIADRADQAKAGNDNATCQGYFPPFACLSM